MFKLGIWRRVITLDTFHNTKSFITKYWKLSLKSNIYFIYLFIIYKN